MTENCWCGGETKLTCLSSPFHEVGEVTEKKIPERLYVSGPMTGYPECNYPAFNEAARRLRAEGFVVDNPAEVGAEGGKYADLLRKDIRLLLDCDGVALLPGWSESRGAKTEVHVAETLGLEIKPLEAWLSKRSTE